MQISVGNGGWLRVDLSELPGPLYVRLCQSESGRWTVTEVYVDGRDQPVTGAMLRGLPVARIEDIANDEDMAEVISSRAGLQRVLLSEAASYFATGFGSQARHWVAEMHRSQGGSSPEVTTRPDDGDEVHIEAPPLRPPDQGLTDDFLRSVARSYTAAVLGDEHPAKALAEQAGVSVRNVHRWIYTARQRGILARADRKRGEVQHAKH